MGERGGGAHLSTTRTLSSDIPIAFAASAWKRCAAEPAHADPALPAEPKRASSRAAFDRRGRVVLLTAGELGGLHGGGGSTNVSSLCGRTEKVHP